MSNKHLTEAEMLQLTLNYSEQQVEKKEIELQDSFIRELKLKKEVLKLQSLLLDKAITTHTSTKNIKTDQLESIKAEHRKLIASIATKYELDEKWGFNPDTGQLII